MLDWNIQNYQSLLKKMDALNLLTNGGLRYDSRYLFMNEIGSYQKKDLALQLSWGLMLTLRVSMGCLTIVESRAESPLLRLRPSAFHTSNRHATSLTEKNKTKKRKKDTARYRIIPVSIKIRTVQ